MNRFEVFRESTNLIRIKPRTSKKWSLRLYCFSFGMFIATFIIMQPNFKDIKQYIGLLYTYILFIVIPIPILVIVLFRYLSALLVPIILIIGPVSIFTYSSIIEPKTFTSLGFLIFQIFFSFVAFVFRYMKRYIETVSLLRVSSMILIKISLGIYFMVNILVVMFFVHIYFFFISFDMNEMLKKEIWKTIVIIFRVFHMIWTYRIMIHIFEIYVASCIGFYILGKNIGQNISIKKEGVKNLSVNLSNAVYAGIVKAFSIVDLSGIPLYAHKYPFKLRMIIARIAFGVIFGLVFNLIEPIVCQKNGYVMVCTAIYNLDIDDAETFCRHLTHYEDSKNLFLFKYPSYVLFTLRFIFMALVFFYFKKLYVHMYKRKIYLNFEVLYSTLFFIVSLFYTMMESAWRAIIVCYFHENDKVLNLDKNLHKDISNILVGYRSYCSLYSLFYNGGHECYQNNTGELIVV